MNRRGLLFLFILISLSLHLLIILYTDVPTTQEKAEEPVTFPIRMTVVTFETPSLAEPPAPDAALQSAAQPALRPEPEPTPEPEAKPEPVAEQQPEPSPPSDTAKPAAETHPPEPAASDTQERAEASEALEVSGAPVDEDPFAGLKKRIRDHTDGTYPLAARKRNLQDVIYVKIRLDEDGYMLESSIIRGSSHSILNRAALDLIDQVMKTPYPHRYGKTVSIVIPVTYKLSR